MLNQIRIDGRLGKDAETITFEDKNKMVMFDIAHNGESATTWVPIRVVKDGSKAAGKLKKGTLVRIEGELRERRYVSQQTNQTVKYLYIRAEKVTKINK